MERAFGAGEGKDRHRLIPNIGLIVFDAVFFQEHQKLFLERTGAVVFFLLVDVGAEGIQIRGADRKASVAALPRKCRVVGRLCFQPFGRRGFQVLDEVGNGEGAGQSDGQMHVVGHAARTITFTSGVTRNRGEVRVKIGPRVGLEKWATILRTEDDVNDDEA